MVTVIISKLVSSSVVGREAFIVADVVGALVSVVEMNE